MHFPFHKLILPALLAPLCILAQVPQQLPPGGLIQLQTVQPTVDVSSPVTATAGFEPPMVRPGEKTFYRVTVDAAEAAIQWPEEIPAPPALQFGPNSHGQMTQFLGNKFRSLTTFIYEVRATAAGHFSVSNFTVNVSGEPLTIPAASVDVVATNPNPQPARQLVLETTATNVFLGQPFRVRVLLPAGPANEIEALREIQLNGGNLMTDKTTFRQSVEVITINGQAKPAFICDMTVTPIVAGTLNVSAQGYTCGREFSGPISIRGQVSIPGGPTKYVFLVSDPTEIKVRPLPAEGELSGFTGAMGKFFREPPLLSTNRLRVGEPVHLKIGFRGENDLARLVPPALPRSRDWQIIADKPPAMGFTLIPQTDEVHETPTIPFSYFDPATGKYVDATIPPLPVTVAGEGLPTQVAPIADESPSAAPLRLTGFAPSPGSAVAGLKPLQLRGWFVGLQLLPLFGFVALWRWDQRRRFLEAHPEIVRRTQARRALRRQKQKMLKAAEAGDAAAFIQHVADAMKIAVAPHYPANPQALVCGDVLAQLDAAASSRVAETIVKIFSKADRRFSVQPETPSDLPGLQAEVATALLKLEEKL